MKTSRHAYGAKRMIFETNDRPQHEPLSFGDMIVEDGDYYLVIDWTKNTQTGEVSPTTKHKLDPAKMQALHGGRADYYYPGPIVLPDQQPPQ